MTTTARAAFGMGAITAVSRALGLVRVVVVLVVLGTTYLGDAFNSANLVSNVLFELLAAGALSAVLVPTFVNLLEGGDQRGAEEVAGGVLGVALAGLGAVTVVGVVAAPLIARALTFDVAPDLLSEQRDLIGYLLRFFIPQVLLYAAGTIAIAILYAYRRFAVTAAAPIGNTVVMVACLLAFRAVADVDADVSLTGGEKLLLVAAGTGGVLAFVGSLLVACARTGFRLRPSWPRSDQRVFELLRHSGWGVALHSAAGMLLGGAVVAGTAVEGGVVAYHSAWVFFLAPYGILAQPLHTAVLPEMVTEARELGTAQVAASLRWALERMALLVLPVTAAMVTMALPAMRLFDLGEVTPEGTKLLAAALAGLGLGLYAYSAFLLFARGYYALGDSRTPGLVALVSGLSGLAVMAVGVAGFDGPALVAMLGIAHSVAYGVGALVLARGLVRRTGSSLYPPVVLRIAVVSAVVGGFGWAVSRAMESADPSKLADLSMLVGVGLVGGGLILVGYRLAGVQGALSPRVESSTPSGALAP